MTDELTWLEAVTRDGLTLNMWRQMNYRDASNLVTSTGILVAEVKRLREALMTCAYGAGDDPFFNKGGQGYEALFGGEEE